MEDLRNSLEQRLRQTAVPGISLAVIDRGAVVWADAFGLADASDGTRLTRDHLIYACSMSKFLTAMTTLAACDHYRLDLDADVNRYLRTWSLPECEQGAGQPVTLRSLLCHQAGLSDADGSFDRAPIGSRAPSLMEILNGQTRLNPVPVRLARDPYARFEYSDSGYCVVEQALVDVSAKPFGKLVEELVMKPLGLQRSFLEQPLAAVHQPAAASGHNPDGTLLEGRFPVYPYLAAAGLWCTPSDFAQLLLELSRALSGRGAVLSRQAATQMVAAPAEPGIGLGNFRWRATDEALRFHYGWGQGFQCQFLFDCRRGSGAVVMINANPGLHQRQSLVGETVRLLASEYGWTLTD